MDKITWKTEKRKLLDLKPYEKNPRKITAQAMEKLKDRIRKRGFHDVLKVDTNDVVLSGNMRRAALIDLDVFEVKVKVPSRKLTKEERDIIVLESNKNDGTWDDEMLPEFDSEVLVESGFESLEVDSMKKEEEDNEDDFDAEEVVKAAKAEVSKKGELYRLGEHYLMCGDSTSIEDIDRLMGGAKADMVFTDPPYNMNYRSKTKGGILNDNMGQEAFVRFSSAFMAALKHASREGAPFYVCSGYSSMVPFMYAMKENGLEFASTIVWVKNTLGMGMNDYRHKHEIIMKAKNKKKKGQPILYGWNEGKHYFIDAHDEADIWEVSKRSTNTMSHPTQKPLALINKAVKNSSKRGQIVLDLFGGSGSTLVSAAKTGRRAYLMELDPKYVDAIIKRWEAMTGIKAEMV